MRFLDYLWKDILKVRAWMKSGGTGKAARCSQGEGLDSRSVNQSPSRRQKRNWTTQSVSDMQILNTVFWHGSSDTNKGFHSLRHPGCFFFQHLGNSSSHSRDSFRDPSLHLLELLAHPSHLSTLTVMRPSHFTSLRHILALAGLTCPQVAVHGMSAP